MAIMADECMEHALTFAIDSSTAAQHWLVPLPSQHQDAATLQQQQQLGSVGYDADAAEELGRSVLLVAEALFLRGVLGDDDLLRVLSAMPNPGDAYRDGGFGGVPASASAVAGLEKRVYCRGGGQGGPSTTDTGCVICLEDFVAGDEIA
ncbi:uncharacterized protein [Triticum aestivum]|uniref:uncharacterized protein isoform X2 n=1 Tax=Triticum aestivum TaxID=4565 RepID=UPI000989D754|nr:uncharacterized protein LOC109745501 [Aegilops tauschii subsp. strangulata]XP_044359588.1 uncharacterized protein LOC123080718 isoform X2 [Triticum aestivum]XP_044359589.1 uncharacterized protein LOC123080718 isoform X2 [Triticum aestivum]